MAYHHASLKRTARYSVLGALTLFLVISSAPVDLTPQPTRAMQRHVLGHGALQAVLTPPAFAQRLSAADFATHVYTRMPSLPLENEYVDEEAGGVDPDNTLLSRLIRYHLYVARRSPNYRLDWKITLADYLGVNDWIRDEEYPSSSDLTVNPKDGDIEAIRALNRAERDALVQELVTIFAEQGDRLPTYGQGY